MMTYPTFLISQLLEAATTLFDDLAYDEIWDASFIHYRIFAESEWCKGEQTEYMEIENYMQNELKAVIR